MKNCIRLASAYVRYYKKQTLALLMGVVLSASILTGIGSLLDSGRAAALENAKVKYGDWHYELRYDDSWSSEFQNQMSGKGYRIDKDGFLTIRKVIEEPYQIELAYADQNYLDMMGRELTEGHYPGQKNEVAMDAYTLRNLEIPEKLGSRVELDGETFTLCGIVSDMPEMNRMQVFVNQELDYGKNGTYLYVKFDESQKTYKQAGAFIRQMGIRDEDYICSNASVIKFLGGDAKANPFKVIKEGITLEGTGLPYIWGSLNNDWNLTDKAILAALGLFGAFIMYSLFQVSIIKRMSQYSIMQTVGMEDKATFGVLFAELFMIFLAGYPIGCMLGNGAAALLYRRIGQIFIPPESSRVHTGIENMSELPTLPTVDTFHVSWNVMGGGAAFLFLFLIVTTVLLVRRMKKITARELMAKETGRKKSRKIYSAKTGNLTGVLTKKFMFARKGAFVGILFSLSAGSLIFLGTTYITQTTRTHNELSFKADDGLASDIQVYEESDELKDTIPASSVTQLEKIEALESVSPVRYMLGEIPFPDGTFQWTEYYPEIDRRGDEKPDQVLMEKYNGVAVQTGKDDYLLKVNIYGYDDEMLEALNDYLLEGEIRPDMMRKENSVIFKTLMDGQGNYNGFDLSIGDQIQVKTPDHVNIDVQDSPEILRFQAAEDQYEVKKFKVAALTSRPMGKVDTFIGDNENIQGRVDIIMTNEQMKENFGVDGYQTISISLKEGVDATAASKEIKKVVSGIPKCIVKDFTSQIEVQNSYLNRKMIFFYGVALIIFIISLLHIMNSMQYLVMARKHEFGIMRAMGITDAGFRKMLVKEGLRYGIYSSLVMVAAYLILQKFLYYFVTHMLLYLHPNASLSLLPILAMAGINILICIAAVLISGQSVLKQQIIEEIQE
ncbi:FtsX-like permease family protein [Faecalicatena sp. AGMB00832]|uniref:FtsX-like permease family protein n=1 Tax=Faecalicatena faecalis TaxID=2726362 RepID=A0ABS6D9F3_9FIRM|nr:FtsX-like permease family protein [Faecalicatena faecalis]MBU3878233.1 FtsX-like permease family protein [Faecalicatena faecalis]